MDILGVEEQNKEHTAVGKVQKGELQIPNITTIIIMVEEE